MRMAERAPGLVSEKVARDLDQAAAVTVAAALFAGGLQTHIGEIARLIAPSASHLENILLRGLLIGVADVAFPYLGFHIYGTVLPQAIEQEKKKALFSYASLRGCMLAAATLYFASEAAKVIHANLPPAALAGIATASFLLGAFNYSPSESLSGK